MLSNRKYRAWSFSGLNTFELCPRKWENQYITKQFREIMDPDGPLAKGNRIHEAFARYLSKDIPLPDELAEHQPFLDLLREMTEDELLVERQLALDKDFQPCDWKDWDNVFVRAVVDFTGLTGDEALVIDHKTGKYKMNSDQLALQVLVVGAHYPDVKKFKGMFYWTKEPNRREVYDYNRDDFPALWTRMLKRVDAMQDVIDTGVYEPVENGTCAAYCPVADCAYHGGQQ